MRLAKVFATARGNGRPALIPYLMAGDPDLKTSRLLIEALRQTGADILELGVPYGDPLADGPTIQTAASRALRSGTSLEDALELAAAQTEMPVVLFSYYNLLLQYGIQRFAEQAAKAGVAGVIVPDLALEECGEIFAALAGHEIAMPLLVAPSTPLERARRVAATATGFLYVVARLGVTGANEVPDFAHLRHQVAELRKVTSLPLAVGFGLSTAQHVRAVSDWVDGIIIGSALIDVYGSHSGAQAVAAASTFFESLRLAATK